jgi:RNA polymerase sigma factor (TIGR02999 family)
MVLSAMNRSQPAPQENVPQIEAAAASALEWLEGAKADPGLTAALPGLYDELRDLAASYLRRERPGHTLQPTALVHESYLRLLNQRTVDWSNRLQFLSIAARMMRRILADHAAARKTAKRGSDAPKVELDAALDVFDKRAIDIAEVDQALRDLEILDPRQAQVVELRFFAGLTIQETAELMALSETTVRREWMMARSWLQQEISSER